DMVESMAASSERIRQYEIIHGKEAVESLLDACLAVQEHIDPSLLRPKLRWKREDESTAQKPVKKERSSPYDDLWRLD
ncbi:SpoVR family protein, partial [Frankia sp. Cpl3]|nr:SpoVR family protein [Frankia sp. Cpl3]